MNKERIIVEADHSNLFIWVDCCHADLTDEEEGLLSTALWSYKYQINCSLYVRNFRKPHKQYQFIIDAAQIDLVAKRLVEIVKELFPNKLVEFSEKNKYY